MDFVLGAALIALPQHKVCCLVDTLMHRDSELFKHYGKHAYQSSTSRDLCTANAMLVQAVLAPIPCCQTTLWPWCHSRRPSVGCPLGCGPPAAWHNAAVDSALLAVQHFTWLAPIQHLIVLRVLRILAASPSQYAPCLAVSPSNMAPFQLLFRPMRRRGLCYWAPQW